MGQILMPSPRKNKAYSQIAATQTRSNIAHDLYPVYNHYYSNWLSNQTEMRDISDFCAFKRSQVYSTTEFQRTASQIVKQRILSVYYPSSKRGNYRYSNQSMATHMRTHSQHVAIELCRDTQQRVVRSTGIYLKQHQTFNV